MTTPDTLQTLTHEELVQHVETRVTGTEPARSSYRPAPGVLPVKIKAYPRRPRPDVRATSAQRWAATTGAGEREVTYEDLLAAARVAAA
jgi:hypothetical protein